MLLAAWLRVLTCICREMQVPAWGAGEEPCSRTASLRCWWPSASLTAGITTTFMSTSPYEQLPRLSSGQGRAHAHLPAEKHTDNANSHSLQWSANMSSAPSPLPQPFYPRGTSASEIIMHLKDKLPAASSLEGRSPLGSDMLMVPSVRPAKQTSKSSSVFTPAQVHFPAPTSPLCLWEVFQP